MRTSSKKTIRQNFEPLLDPAFDDALRRPYPSGVEFEVNSKPLIRAVAERSARIPVAIRLGRRRSPCVVGFLERDEGLPADREGIAISTFGKVIKRGWDWLGLAPVAHAHITGLLEASDLAACLTLSKNDFIRSGARGATYLAYRKAIQEVISRQLAEWGDRSDTDTRPRMARLERDLERVLEDLAEDFPLLRSLVDRRSGGQKRLPMPGRGREMVSAPLFVDVPIEMEFARERTPPQEAEPEYRSERERVKSDRALSQIAASDGTPASMAGRRRHARYGLRVQFESRPGDAELARLVDSTIWLNDVHPAFVRALASRSVRYHTALAVALALAPLAVDPRDEHAFITQFLAQWGGAPPASRTLGRKRSKKTA